jgi:hypothetical protein
MEWGSVPVAAVAGAIAGAATSLAKDLVLHFLKRRLDRRAARRDALLDLQGALGHIEDVWQSTGGRISNHHAAERPLRLQEYRDTLNGHRKALEAALYRELSGVYDAMATSAQVNKAAEVVSHCQGGLARINAALTGIGAG